MGAAMLFYYSPTQTKEKKVDVLTLYLGPKKRTYTAEQISEICPRPGVVLEDCDDPKVVELLIDKNIVSIFPRTK